MKALIVACAIFGLATTALAAKERVFNCYDTEDDAREDIVITVNGKNLSIVNYWGDGRRDSGIYDAARSRVASKREAVYHGFPTWVDDGRPGSGYLYVSFEAQKKGVGIFRLESTQCDDVSCGQRVAPLQCTQVSTETRR